MDNNLSDPPSTSLPTSLAFQNVSNPSNFEIGNYSLTLFINFTDKVTRDSFGIP